MDVLGDDSYSKSWLVAYFSLLGLMRVNCLLSPFFLLEGESSKILDTLCTCQSCLFSFCLSALSPLMKAIMKQLFSAFEIGYFV